VALARGFLRRPRRRDEYHEKRPSGSMVMIASASRRRNGQSLRRFRPLPDLPVDTTQQASQFTRRGYSGRKLFSEPRLPVPHSAEHTHDARVGASSTPNAVSEATFQAIRCQVRDVVAGALTTISRRIAGISRVQSADGPSLSRRPAGPGRSGIWGCRTPCSGSSEPP
jgi:hypothetical protein